jgi:hypothetical protein
MAYVVDHSFVTVLPVGQIATTFRDDIQKIKGIFGKTAGAMLGWGWRFSTPTQKDDPFAAFEGQQAPVFSVIGHFGMQNASEPTTNVGAIVQVGTSGSVRLDIWDEGDRRRVRIRRPKDASMKLRGALNTVFNSYRAADRTIKITEQTLRIQKP